MTNPVSDPEVLAAWQACQQAGLRRSARLRVPYLAALAIFFVVAPWLPEVAAPWLAGLAVLTLVAVEALRHWFSYRRMRCPHCAGKPLKDHAGVRFPPNGPPVVCPQCGFLLSPAAADAPWDRIGPLSPVAYLSVLYVAQALFFLTFFAIVSFANADPVVAGAVNGTPVPPAWEAAVRDHQWYYRWFVFAQHRAASFAWLAVMVAGAVVGARLFEESAGQLRAGTPTCVWAITDRAQAAVSSTWEWP